MAAESGMDTCPSPEISDSRKRPLDGDAENGATKRSHYGASKQVIVQCLGYEIDLAFLPFRCVLRNANMAYHGIITTVL
jgi:hypothetical protein